VQVSFWEAHGCKIERSGILTVYRGWDGDGARAARVDMAKGIRKGLETVRPAAWHGRYIPERKPVFVSI